MAKIIGTTKPFASLAKEQSVIVSRADRNIKAHFLAHQLASIGARPAAQGVELVLRGTFAKGVPFKVETRQMGGFFPWLFPPRIPKGFSATTKSLPWDCPSLQVQTREGTPLIAIVDVDPKPSLRTQRSLREGPPGRFLVVAPNTGLTPRATRSSFSWPTQRGPRVPSSLWKLPMVSIPSRTPLPASRGGPVPQAALQATAYGRLQVLRTRRLRGERHLSGSPATPSRRSPRPRTTAFSCYLAP
jgi:hypothetical protein